MMKDLRNKRLVITGPESCGKTTIAGYLSGQLSVDLVPEFARTYLELLNGKYEFQDIELIAKGAERQYLDFKSPNLILDTDIVTLKIWSEVKYGQCSDWINDRSKECKNRLYLLCYPDIPWVNDSLRENEHDRLSLFSQYETFLQSRECNYFIICGSKLNREKTSLSIAKAYFE